MRKRIALFLWRIAVRLIEPQRGKVVGLPYNRDPEHPCEYYEPGPRGQYAFDDCETDGHYLCKKCIHRVKEAGKDDPY